MGGGEGESASESEREREIRAQLTGTKVQPCGVGTVE